ncbi:hypothetical protein P691DRAFT_429248 [Macrolepiota fuliginosa MF-IS2]|uniref:Uncharacterized protein n=1 Tax=Macrolepiota fuliginosa MF-IS2 TaxID=1400762 RepID=A0A9P5XG96_9AGAR|nr:hypothetical protein P691DRAFT_429248 [Macrolepiota fuliginosa MF-IS2]
MWLHRSRIILPCHSATSAVGHFHTWAIFAVNAIWTTTVGTSNYRGNTRELEAGGRWQVAGTSETVHPYLPEDCSHLMSL